MYTICKKVFANEPYSAVRRSEDDASIPFAPSNIDYQRFKREINADEAQLQNADGNLMSAVDAKAFVATLP